MTPRVSVILPCFNAGAYIRETIQSVSNQTYPNIEVIAVNDGSTDSTGDILESLRPNGLIVVNQANLGQTAALNAGLARAGGDFVQYLDADDLLDPQKLEIQIARLLDNPRCIASARWGRFYGHPEGAVFENEAVDRDLAPLDWLAASRAEGLGMMFPALWLIPMDIVREAGPWREDLTLNNDAEYFTRVVLTAEQVLYCADARCRYRSGIRGSLSRQKTSGHWRSQLTVLDLCERRVLAREDSERMRRGFALSWQHFAHACYPYDRAIAEKALARARALHPVEIVPGGGPSFKAMRRLLGWRTARRLQVASGRP